MDKPAERVINADPAAWYRVTHGVMGKEAFADLSAALHDPQVVHAMLEDYRAGLGVDREADEADRTHGTRPVPHLDRLGAGRRYRLLYDDPVAIWSRWADDVRGATIDCGHHMSEEAPGELSAMLLDFFAAPII